MRAALIGAIFAHDRERRLAYVAASTRITHTDPKALIVRDHHRRIDGLDRARPFGMSSGPGRFHRPAPFVRLARSGMVDHRGDHRSSRAKRVLGRGIGGSAGAVERCHRLQLPHCSSRGLRLVSTLRRLSANAHGGAGLRRRYGYHRCDCRRAGGSDGRGRGDPGGMASERNRLAAFPTFAARPRRTAGDGREQQPIHGAGALLLARHPAAKSGVFADRVGARFSAPAAASLDLASHHKSEEVAIALTVIGACSPILYRVNTTR